SNSSGTGLNGLGNGTQLDSGHPSPTPPMFRDILLSTKPNSAASSSQSSSSPSAIGGPSPNLDQLSSESLESPLSSCFLNAQLAAVASDLCDLNDLPNLIPPSESSTRTADSLYGNSPFDLQLPSMSNPTPDHSRGILGNTNPLASRYFSEYS